MFESNATKKVLPKPNAYVGYPFSRRGDPSGGIRFALAAK